MDGRVTYALVTTAFKYLLSEQLVRWVPIVPQPIFHFHADDCICQVDGFAIPLEKFLLSCAGCGGEEIAGWGKPYTFWSLGAIYEPRAPVCDHESRLELVPVE